MSYKYPFLAHPPPTAPKLPPHTFAAIRAWAASVTPGSPAPCSPLSSSRRPSLLTGPPSLAVLNLTQDAFDLTALGYTSVFVHLPKTPTTPSPLLREFDLKHRRTRTPADTAKRTAIRRFRSLSILRPRAKQPKAHDPPPSPSRTAMSAKSAKKPKPKAPAPALPSPRSATSPGSPAEICAASIAKRKRAKYAYVRPPPTLAQELAVMQFADGGSMEKNVRRAMEHQAKLAAGSRAPAGVADVYRDGAGGIWWDADEELEYAHLLAGAPAQDVPRTPRDDDWEAFDAGEPLASFLAPMAAAPAVRRTSLSSCDSDLDPVHLLPLPEHEDRTRVPPDDRALASHRIGGPALGPVLSLPARPRRLAPHLAHARFVGDVAEAFGSPYAYTDTDAEAPMVARPKGKARRRPAPLTITRSAHAPSSGARSTHRTVTRPSAPVPAPTPPPSHALPALPLASRARSEFIADSFAPPCAAPTPALLARAIPPSPLSPAASMMRTATRGVRTLFTRRAVAVGGGDAQ